MIVENFLAEIHRLCDGAEVIDVREVAIPKPGHGHNVLIEFDNGFILRIDGYISIERDKL